MKRRGKTQDNYYKFPGLEAHTDSWEWLEFATQDFVAANSNLPLIISFQSLRKIRLEPSTFGWLDPKHLGLSPLSFLFMRALSYLLSLCKWLSLKFLLFIRQKQVREAF